MLKKEIIWREILFQATEQNKYNFQQKKLANQFSFSLSTVFNALKTPRGIKAIKVNGRGFTLVNPEKLLYLWATERKLEKDIVYHTFVSKAPIEIEREMPDKIIWGLFSAYRYKFGDTPSDYDKIYIYAGYSDLGVIKQRFPKRKGPENLFVLQRDRFLNKYGSAGTLGQIFVDIWNTNYWYNKEFLKRIEYKMNL